MEKSIFVRVGLAMEAVDVVSKDTFKLEAHTFEEAVKLSLNAIVSGDYTVDIGDMFYGFYVSISNGVSCSDAEAEAEIDKALQHVRDMIASYGIHFGGCLMLAED